MVFFSQLVVTLAGVRAGFRARLDRGTGSWGQGRVDNLKSEVTHISPGPDRATRGHDLDGDRNYPRLDRGRGYEESVGNGFIVVHGDQAGPDPSYRGHDLSKHSPPAPD